MIYSAPDYPKAFSWDFYTSREPADHWNQPGYHHERLAYAIQLMVAQITLPPKSIADFACGCGGLLAQLRNIYPDTKIWGYDISTTAIEFAKEHYNLNIQLADITAQGLIPENVSQAKLQYPEWVILTETLEHLLNPMELLIRLRKNKVHYIIASIPATEGVECSEHHNWAWTEDSFGEMFELCGYYPKKKEVAIGTQYFIGESIC